MMPNGKEFRVQSSDLFSPHMSDSDSIVIII